VIGRGTNSVSAHGRRCSVWLQVRRKSSEADVATRFLCLLGELLAAAEVGLFRPDGKTGSVARERQVGWVDRDGVYLLPDVAFQAVRDLAERTGEPITASQRTLNSRLRDDGMLATTGKDEGRRRSRSARRSAVPA